MFFIRFSDVFDDVVEEIRVVVGFAHRSCW